MNFVFQLWQSPYIWLMWIGYLSKLLCLLINGCHCVIWAPIYQWNQFLKLLETDFQPLLSTLFKLPLFFAAHVFDLVCPSFFLIKIVVNVGRANKPVEQESEERNVKELFQSCLIVDIFDFPVNFKSICVAIICQFGKSVVDVLVGADPFTIIIFPCSLIVKENNQKGD